MSVSGWLFANKYRCDQVGTIVVAVQSTSRSTVVSCIACLAATCCYDIYPLSDMVCHWYPYLRTTPHTAAFCTLSARPHDALHAVATVGSSRVPSSTKLECAAHKRVSGAQRSRRELKTAASGWALDRFMA